MYIIKNAFRCIGRSMGRNILIAVSACIGLSIRQASVNAKESALEGMSVTATISYDRASAMGDMAGGRPGMSGGGNNPFGDMLGGAADYVTEIDSAMNLTVVFQMIGVGLLLTLAASAASVLFIMRYDPLKILANRD